MQELTRSRVFFVIFVLACSALWLPAQWLPITPLTQSDLLSVDVRDQAVWVSGEDNTVLRSSDGGQSWQACSPVTKIRGTAMVGIAAIDPTTAVVISSGKGQSSRAYRTSDGCKSWQVVFENVEPSSSFDTLRRVAGQQIYLLAEPVSGKFPMYLSQDGGQKWFVTDDAGLDALPGESAQGSTIVTVGPYLYFGSRAVPKPQVHFSRAKCAPGNQSESCPIEWTSVRFPTEANHLRALATRTATGMSGKLSFFVMGISSDEKSAMSSISADGGNQWSIPSNFPLAHPVAVAFVPAKQTWIAVGADGTATSDASGKHWVKSTGSTGHPDASWSAISFPFVVGAAGRIGRFDPDQLQ